MSIETWHHRLLTLDDWDELPEDDRFRIEVAEGILIVSPRPMMFHQRAVTRLGYLINEQLPAAFSAAAEVELLITENPLTVRVPDVLVTDTHIADANPAQCHPSAVHLVIEVLSEGSVRTDRVTKFSEYAEVGIKQYWIVDLTAPTTLTRYQLIDEDYELLGEHTGKLTVDFKDTPISVDLDTLTTSRAQQP